MNRKLMRRVLAIFLCLLVFAPYVLSSEVSAGKLKPPNETFTPGQWFLGDRPTNYDSSKAPIVFVQGKNGSSTSWYGETTYHGVNDMYTMAYDAGYQTVFVQLYDAAGNGSEDQYTNGRLLASMLGEISRHFNGQKVNIIAHSKGGPDTQAALIHYGAYSYVDKVITLGSPHYGSELADLSYSWYAGWLGELLGMNDAGTYSLQVGEMAKFRSVTDSNPNRSKNKYYTVAGTNKGPALSALSLGGAYLSFYGANDGLVTVTSSKLPYGTHLFTDNTIDHDNIRQGSKVFSRIEPYLRSTAVSQLSDNTEALNQTDTVIQSESSNYINGDMLSDSQLSDNIEALNQTDTDIQSESSSYINGGMLSDSQFTKNEIYVPATTRGTIFVYTASNDTTVELVAPDGTIMTASGPIKDDTIISGASLYSFQLDEFIEGSWTVQMKATNAKDAYLLVSSFDEPEKIVLNMAGKGKADQTSFTLKAPKQDGTTRLSFKFRDPEGNELKQSIIPNTTNGAEFTSKLPKVSKPGVYNMTVDMTTKHPNGKESVRTLVRSVYIE
ncbi:lipase family alpha/beta hydrolase [Lysinibacillus xylanilyticus]|uniref:lipase family alpha/beta hydrolase n=1 Tax=Lysinibacillus xylanilyticus TaxID=582475 RepID=UPI003D08456D